MTEPRQPDDFKAKPPENTTPPEFFLSDEPEPKPLSGMGGFIVGLLCVTPLIVAGWFVVTGAVYSVLRDIGGGAYPFISLVAAVVVVGAPVCLAWVTGRRGLAAGMVCGVGLIILGFGVICGGILR